MNNSSAVIPFSPLAQIPLKLVSFIARSFDRFYVYDFEQGKVAPAFVQVRNFTSFLQSANDKQAMNYLQSLSFFSLIGVVGVVSLILILMTQLCSCCLIRCRLAIKKREDERKKREKEKEKKKRNSQSVLIDVENPNLLNAAYQTFEAPSDTPAADVNITPFNKEDSATSSCCDVLSFVKMMVFVWCVALMISSILMWSFTAPIVNRGMFGVLDKNLNNTVEALNLMNETFSLGFNASSVGVQMISETKDFTTANVLQQIPQSTDIDNILQQCIMKLWSELPSFEGVYEFVVDAYDQLQKFPSKSFLTFLFNMIQTQLQVMKEVNFTNLYASLQTVQSVIEGELINSIYTLIQLVGDTMNLVSSFPAVEKIRALYLSMDHPFEETITDDFLVDLQAGIQGLNDPASGRDPRDVGNKMVVLAKEIDVMKQNRYIDQVADIMQTVQDKIGQLPSSADFVARTESIDYIIKSKLNLLPIGTAIQGLNVSLRATVKTLKSLNETVTEFVGNIETFPSFAPVWEVLTQVNSTFDDIQCIDNPIQLILKLGKELIVLPPYIQSLVEQTIQQKHDFLEQRPKLDQFIATISLTEILLTQTIPSYIRRNLLSNIEKYNVESVFNFDALDVVESTITKLNTDIQESWERLQIESIADELKQIDLLKASIPDFTDEIQSLRELQSNMDSFDTQPFYLANKYIDKYCLPTFCPFLPSPEFSQFEEFKKQILQTIERLRVIRKSRPSKAVVLDKLELLDKFFISLPDYNAFAIKMKTYIDTMHEKFLNFEPFYKTIQTFQDLIGNVLNQIVAIDITKKLDYAFNYISTVPSDQYLVSQISLVRAPIAQVNRTIARQVIPMLKDLSSTVTLIHSKLNVDVMFAPMQKAAEDLNKLLHQKQTDLNTQLDESLEFIPDYVREWLQGYVDSTSIFSDKIVPHKLKPLFCNEKTANSPATESLAKTLGRNTAAGFTTIFVLTITFICFLSVATVILFCFSTHLKRLKCDKVCVQCHQKCVFPSGFCWLLLGYILVFIMLCALIAILLPMHVLLEDTCPVVQQSPNTVLNSPILLGIKSQINEMLSLKFSISFKLDDLIQFQTTISMQQLVDNYFFSDGCPSSEEGDIIFKAINDAKQSIQQLQKLDINQYMKSKGYLPPEFPLQDALTTKISEFIAQETAKVSNVIDQIPVIAKCDRLRSIYTTPRDSVCKDVREWSLIAFFFFIITAALLLLQITMFTTLGLISLF